jgi:predicted nucleic acid-binding protein
VLVVDASMVASWILPDEANTGTEAVAELVRTGGAAVPRLYDYEVANLLVVATRRGRMTTDLMRVTLAELQRLPIQRHGPSPISDLIDLAQRHSLTAYVAAYLELALRERLPLATLDKDLRKAARKAGVTLI